MTSSRKNAGLSEEETAGTPCLAGEFLRVTKKMSTKISPATNITPAMRQYLEVKEDLGDAIVFFRMGDFYEMFFDDAVTASKILGIALTARDRKKEIPMCGFPYHAATGYIKKLIHEGHRVAVCEQVEDPASAKGLVRREVTRVITPGTAIEDELLEPGDNNFIAAVNLTGKVYGLSYMDLSTGEFMVTEFESSEELLDELMRLRPLEVLLPEEEGPNAELRSISAGPGLATKKLTTLPPREFQPSLNTRRLSSHFGTAGLQGFGCDGLRSGLGAAGALLEYIKETQKSGLNHIRKISPYVLDQYMVMDYSTRRNLEVLENSRTGARSGTLIEVLDRTATAMGARLLRKWMLRPLKDLEPIKHRLCAVEELVGEPLLRETARALLRGVHDLERLSSRVSMRSATPRDLVAMRDSLKKVAELRDRLQGVSSPLLYEIQGGLDPVEEASVLIGRAIVENPPIALRDGGVIRQGYDSELDSFREIGSGGKDSIAALEQEERKKTGINSLKVGYNRVFGYYIEVRRASLASVPPEYIRKQTLVNAERFITEDLKRWEERILGAEERAKALETSLYRDIIERLCPLMSAVRETAEKAAALDVLISFSLSAIKHNYIRPMLNDSEALRIEGGRHPVVEAAMDASTDFVPNDLSLDSAGDALVILTGPNMAGKSTYLRQNALIVYMAQIGSFVPALEAEIGLVDRIFTRVGAWDDLSRGQSTFMVEMNETANILNNATSRSLVILDEIGRGTSTFDGLSIAWAVVEYLHDHFKDPPRTLFATHYIELTELSLTKERVKNYNMLVKDWEGRVIFLRKVVPGQSNSSYGIHVASLAGLPEEVLARAREILSNLEHGELTGSGMPRIARPCRLSPSGVPEGKGPEGTRGDGAKGRGGDKGARGPEALEGGSANLLGREDRLRSTLRSMDLERTTPIEALNLLHKLREMIDDS